MATTQKARSEGSRSTGAARSSQKKSSSAAAETGSQSATVHLPYVTAEFRRPEMPDFHVPGREEISGAVNAAWENLPSRKMMAYYAGLGALATFSLIEWPVAAAIGVGTAVTQQAAAGGSSSGSTSSKRQNRSGSESA